MIDPLMILRGIAAVLISLYHMSYPYVTVPHFLRQDMNWITAANGFVYNWIFFILSGFVIGKSFITHHYEFNFRGLRKYFHKRVVRIIPAYYFIIIFFLFILPKILKISISLSPSQWLQAFTFNASSQSVAGIGWLWSISPIMQFYLIAPVIYFILDKLTKFSKYLGVFLPLLTILITGLACIHVYNTFHIQFIWEYMTLIYAKFGFNIGFFGFGFVMNYYFSQPNFIRIFVEKHRNILLFMLIPLFILFYCLTSYIRYYSVIDYTKYGFYQIVIFPVLTMILCGVFIIVAEESKYFKSYSAIGKPKKSYLNFFNPLIIIQWIGTISYEYYLIHAPIMTYFGFNCLYNTYGCSVGVFSVRFISLICLSSLSAWFMHETIRRLYKFAQRKIS
jgi:peptidoglycan/LPS O-acetylase OafA/YrhL